MQSRSQALEMTPLDIQDFEKILKFLIYNEILLGVRDAANDILKVSSILSTFQMILLKIEIILLGFLSNS